MTNPYHAIRAIVESEVSTSAKAVALVLFHHQNRSNGICNPSIATIAFESGMGTTAAKSAIKVLRDEGLVLWETKTPKYRKEKVNHYRLVFAERTFGDHTSDHTEVETTVRTTVETTVQTPDVHEHSEQSKQREHKSYSASADGAACRKKKGRHKYDADYEQFYSAYPKKASKIEGERAWIALRDAGKLFPLEEMLRCLDEYASSNDWDERESKFIPNISTFLNQERFTDKKSILSPEDRDWVDRNVARSTEILERLRREMHAAEKMAKEGGDVY